MAAAPSWSMPSRHLEVLMYLKQLTCFIVQVLFGMKEPPGAGSGFVWASHDVDRKPAKVVCCQENELTIVKDVHVEFDWG
jgi:hypothetical protein